MPAILLNSDQIEKIGLESSGKNPGIFKVMEAGHLVLSLATIQVTGTLRL